MTIYQIFTYFVIYSFMGWVVEVLYHAVVKGTVVNRGFLCGPVCPVYGFGMLAVLAMALSVPGRSGADTNALILFAGGMALATSIELFAGWALDMLFHMRWWDYTGKPFNFHGYICLEFSIIWGLGIVFMIRIVHPVIARVSARVLPERIGWWILAGTYIVYFIDLCLTVAAVRGLNKELKELDELRAVMRRPSDEMSRRIGENALKTTIAIEEGRVQAALAQAELKEQVEESKEKAEERYLKMRQQVLERRSYARKRILTGLDELKHRDYTALLDELKEFVK